MTDAAAQEGERHYAAWRRAKRWRQGVALASFLGVTLLAAQVSEVSMGRLAEGVPALGAYLVNLLPPVRPASAATDLTAWYWALPRWLGLLWDTVLMAFLGTLLAACGALVLGFAAARNLAPHRILGFSCRRLLEAVRTIPELVFALLFVYAFGLGPMAGVLAIALHSLGSLGKLFSEAAENAAPQPLEGLRAAGANWAETVRFGALPQVLPGLVSYTLLRFETNVRAASVIGFVGVGGIGQELYTAVRQFVYADVSALLVLIVLTVTAVDLACEALRRRVSPGGAAA